MFYIFCKYMEVKTMRPEFSKNLSITDFTDFYWLKTELQQFCRENNMSPSGFKMELSKRIEVFLTTGETQQSKTPSKRRSSSKTQAPLTLDTVIGKNHRCSQEVRKKQPSYQKEIAPQFEYNRFIRDFFNDPKNKGKGRDDAIAAWKQLKLQPGSNQYRS